MRRGDFARIAGVSAAMVTKWGREGWLVEGLDGVDAAATLDRLAGSFDEPRRLAAIARLQRAASPDASLAPPAPDTAITARAQREAIDARLRRLDLEERAGRLIERQAVDDLLADACRSLAASFDQGHKRLADSILALPPDAANRKALIAATIRDHVNETLTAFATNCAAIAAQATETVTLPESAMHELDG